MGGVRITGVTHSTVGPFVSVQIQLYFPMKWHGPRMRRALKHAQDREPMT
jgi:hypothetical protein